MLISANLGFDYVLASQAQKHVTMNEAIAKLDVLVQATALDKDLTSPPAGPVEGDTYIVDSTAGGDWLGQENKLASYLNGSWIFYAPRAGWKVYVVDESTVYDYDGAAWTIKSISADTLFNGSLLKLGVNTSATDTTRLAVKTDSIVFSHDDITPGTGALDTIFNKATAGDTLALTFQTGFSGRVIAGLLGNDDFTFRVSSNGSLFNDAFVVDSGTAKTDFKVVPSINGSDVWSGDNDGSGSGLDADLLDGNHAAAFALLTGATFTGGIVQEQLSPSFELNTTAISGVQSYFKMEGARTSVSATIAQIDFYNNGAGVEGTSAQWLVGGDGDVNLSVGTLQVAGGVVWHANNDGAGSGLDADLLDGIQASAFAQLSGATFTGGITATGFTGNGGGLTGVDAANLGGQSAASYALLSGAAFSGAVTAASFSGDGASVTNVDAVTLDGIDSTSFVQAGTNLSLQSLALTDADNAFSWENGVHWINGNDGGGNVNIRLGHNHAPRNSDGISDEVFTHAGTAYHIGGAVDSGVGTLQFKIATNGGAGIGEPVTWGSVLDVGQTDLTWDGAQVLTESNVNSITVAGDFAVVQANGGVANVIWWDSSANNLLLGTDGAGGGVIDMRAPVYASNGVGIGGAFSDATNTFAFYGTNLLLNSGSSIDMKYNKNASGNDASMTFQTAFSTKALFGLLGDDNLTLKVGSAFTTAMVANETTGKVSFPEGFDHPKVQAYMNTSTFTVTTAWQTISGWDGTIHNDASGFTWSTLNGDCYIGKTGTFFVSYSISTDMTVGAARSDSLVKLQQYNGTTWNDVPGSIHRMYNRVVAEGGTSASWTGALDANIGDGFRLQVIQETGTDTIVVDQASIMFYRM